MERRPDDAYLSESSKGNSGGMTVRGSLQYRELARFYDPLTDWKDYRSEARRVEAIAAQYGNPGRTTWLDVACGTGRHLEFLHRNHPCAGVDGSREMLRIARRRLPHIPLVQADMRSFQLPNRFDVVSCLFSAIGHLRTKRDVRSALANFEAHLKPGGVVVVEPWIERRAFRSGLVHLRAHEDPSITVARMAYSSRQGDHSVIQWHYLIGEPGRGVRYREVTDVGLLLARPELLAFMRATGLRARFVARGLMPGRGLLVGVKPRKA
ncbi:MAG: class I SAM-dependent methyltransferase [Thermoplasmata archaeon]